MDLGRLFLRALVASLTATALLAIGVLLLADFDETTWKIIATTALLSAFSLLAMPGAVLLDQNRDVWLGWLTLALAGWGLAHALFLLWAEEEAGVKFLITVVAFAGASTQASATTGRLRDDDSASVSALYLAGIGGSVLVAILVSFAAWQEIEDGTYYRSLAALVVAVLLVTLLQPILRRSARQGGPAPRYRLTITTRDGTALRRNVDAPDFAAAVASAIREVERSGATVVRVERG